MATGEPDRFDGGHTAEYPPATVGCAIRQFGAALVLLAMVPAVVAGGVVVATGGVGAVLTGATTSGGDAFATAFRVSVGVATAGCWCAGLGLLFEGLFESGDVL